MEQAIKRNRIGETRLNNLGSKMWIIEYIASNNVTIQFEDGYVTTTTYQNFKNGKVKNPYDVSVFGVGYIGEGNYKVTDKNYNMTPQYRTWTHILERCTSEKYHEKQPTYKGCSICKEWLNFQTFAKWYDDNYYTVDNERMALDKDILVKGNKIYSPESCIFAPTRINVLFAKENKDKKFKEQLIKEVAEEYKKKIPIKLYKAMIRYQI